MGDLRFLPFAFAAVYVVIFTAVAYLLTEFVSMEQGPQIAIWAVAAALSLFVTWVASVFYRISRDEEKKARSISRVFSEQ